MKNLKKGPRPLYGANMTAPTSDLSGRKNDGGNVGIVSDDGVQEAKSWVEFLKL